MMMMWQLCHKVAGGVGDTVDTDTGSPNPPEPQDVPNVKSFRPLRSDPDRTLKDGPPIAKEQQMSSGCGVGRRWSELANIRLQRDMAGCVTLTP